MQFTRTKTVSSLQQWLDTLSNLEAMTSINRGGLASQYPSQTLAHVLMHSCSAALTAWILV